MRFSLAGAGQESCRWSPRPSGGKQGTFLGATASKRKQLRRGGKRLGSWRRDPMAMLPFPAATHMGDYFAATI